MNAYVKLWTAVIEQGIQDIKTAKQIMAIDKINPAKTPKQKAKVRQARRLFYRTMCWFRSDECRIPGEFEWICVQVGASASKIREALFLNQNIEM